MAFIKWADKKVKKLDFFDVKLLKLQALAVGLLIAKLWPPLLSLDWQAYLLIAIFVSIRPVVRLYFKK